MIPYFILLTIVSIFLVFGKVKGFGFSYPALFIVLTLFAGFRYMVGIDYEQYQNIFGYVKNGSIFVTKELGFGLFINLLNAIGGTAQLFFFVFAALTQYYTYKSIQKNSLNQGMSILIYFCILSFYLFSFNGVRQSLAVAIFLYCIYFIQESNFKKYTFYILMASLFAHLSVIFFYPIYFIIKKHYTTFHKILALVAAVISGFMIDKLISLSPYAVYLEDSKSFDVGIDSKIYAFLLLGIILELIRYRFDKTNFSNILFNFNFISVLILFMLIFQTNTALILTLKRLHNYILATYIFLIPLIFDHLEYKSKKISEYAFYMLFIFIYIITIIAIGNRIQIVPYNFNFKLF